MTRFSALLQDALVSGAASALVSTGVLAAFGRREAGSPYAPVNAISHWWFGERAMRRDAPSVRHTLTGGLTHFAASIWWAFFYELLRSRRRTSTPVTRLTDAAVVSAVACFVDYRMTPQRLTPGYERRLSRTALAFVYAAFAVGLAAGAEVLARRRHGR